MFPARNYTVSLREFKMGYAFDYWKKKHGRHSKVKVIKAKYSNIKEEILCNKIYSLSRGQCSVNDHKVKQLLNTDKARDMINFKFSNRGSFSQPSTSRSINVLLPDEHHKMHSFTDSAIATGISLIFIFFYTVGPD